MSATPKDCIGAGEHKDSGRGGGARWNRRGTCGVCGKNLALTPSGRIPRHVPAKQPPTTSLGGLLP